jgi:hypothetical protein
MSELSPEKLLVDEYRDWCYDNDLPHISAEELINTDTISVDQGKWLTNFINRWDSLFEY